MGVKFMNKKYLVIQLARFGDLLQSKRLIVSLQQKGQVHLVLDKSLSTLAKLVYPEVILHPILAHGKKISLARILMENRKVLSSLKMIDFDQVINLNFSGMNFALSRLFDSSIVRGYCNLDGQEVRDSLVRLAFRLARERRYSPINLVDYWSFFADKPTRPELVNPVATSSGEGVGVVMAGRDLRRSIPLEVLASFIKAMREKFGGPVYLLGSSLEQPMARKLKGLLEPEILSELIDLTGKTNWTDLVQVVQSLRVVLTPDTGTMHLAAHLGVQVWAFFFSSAWCFETGPYGRGHIIFQVMPHCAPCVESRPCNFDLICHQKLTHKSILKFMLTDYSSPSTIHTSPDDICIFGSDFGADGLGIIYKPLVGRDPYAAIREKLRMVLTLFLNYDWLLDKQNIADILPVTSDLVQEIFPEREWMLPAHLDRES